MMMGYTCFVTTKPTINVKKLNKKVNFGGD